MAGLGIIVVPAFLDVSLPELTVSSLCSLLLQLHALAAAVRQDLQKHRYYPVTAFEERCLLRPQRQHRRRGGVPRGGP